jgi:Amidohydrolase
MAALKRLNDGGVRGIRFSLGDPATAVVKPEMVEPLAKRVAPLGWHVQLNVEGEQVVALEEMLRRLPTDLVFDHLAHPSLPAGMDHASHKIVRDLVDKRRAWVKLSGAYSNSKVGPPYPKRRKSPRLSSKQRPSGWCGAATGLIRVCATSNRTTVCYSNCSPNGRPTRRRVNGYWCEIRKRSTAFRSRFEAWKEKPYRRGREGTTM